MASSYAEEIGAMYLETSAKDDLNVQDIFVKLSTSCTCSADPSPFLHAFFMPGYKLPAPQQADANVVKATSSNMRNQRQSPAKASTCC